VAHRADYDADILYKVYENMLYDMTHHGILNVEHLLGKVEEIKNNIFSVPVTILAKNQKGMKDLYKIVSDANTTYFNEKRKHPMMPLSQILDRRENLLIGSGCSKGYAFKAATGD
jgi:DNA polymerase-3 subunit alpha (Gram-positive type)